VLHTAALAATQDCEDNPEKAYDINVNGSIYIAEACRETEAKLFHFSTEQIFNGNKEKGPYNEDTVPCPSTVYGENKLEAENRIREILDNVWILRLTWLFGFPEKDSRVNPNILLNVLKALLKNEKTKFPANEYRGMTYVYDLISNFEKIFQIPWGTYHTGSENNLSTYDTACTVLNEMGLGSRKDEIIEKDTEKYKENPRDLRISNSKLRDYGISFMTTEEGIKKAIKDFNFRF
jgi:dTDP-4-dehydrorhamnose reductase